MSLFAGLFCVSSSAISASFPFTIFLVFAVLALGVSHVISSAEMNAVAPHQILHSNHKYTSPLRKLLSMKSQQLGYSLISVDDFTGDSLGILPEEFDDGLTKPKNANHYACPPTSLEELRRRYGTSKSVWGEWSCLETRRFYRQQLPFSLQMDGVMGLSLEERAKIAAEARHALRLYSRERCRLPERIVAMAYDGVRHLLSYGYIRWDGMNWSEIKAKYTKRAIHELGEDADEADIVRRMYELIVERACATNEVLDNATIKGGGGGVLLSSVVDEVMKVLPVKAALHALAPLLAKPPLAPPTPMPTNRKRRGDKKHSVLRKIRSSVVVMLRGLPPLL